ncbi:hypothetical protein M378DRAFT_15228 [Amanita muscaria Koide BX008]|uniref:Uncharacterized protein n=1 Tax=Amanita muscaria (strain Koide BX008) TaxID=946122 RepID=A0A0C2SXF8_AMAMK|nr:hypothetical protein M378DRAFT_15228 [Amanita muscaria Koide BX008]
MLTHIVGFMLEFAETLKRHSKLHHRQIFAWRMIQLTEDLNKVLSHTLRESPSWITASYANATPLTMLRELYHPQLPRVPLGPWSAPGPIAKSEPSRPPRTMHLGPPKTPAHISLPNVYTFGGLDLTLAHHVGLHFERRAYPIWAVMLGRPLLTGLLLSPRKVFIMTSHEQTLTHPLTILGHRLAHPEDILLALATLYTILASITDMIPRQNHHEFVPAFARLLNEALLIALKDTHSRIRIVYSDDHTDQSIRAFRRGRRRPKGHPLGLRLDDLVTAQLCAWTIAQCTRMIHHWEGWPLLALSGIASDSSGRAISYARTTLVFPLATPSHGLLFGHYVFLLSNVTNSSRHLQLNDPQRVAPNSYDLV